LMFMPPLPIKAPTADSGMTPITVRPSDDWFELFPFNFSFPLHH